MHRRMLSLVAAFAAAAAMFAAGRMAAARITEEQARSHSDELAWLRTEFGLSEPQIEEVRRLHDAYRPECAQMCARISAASRELADTVSRSTNESAAFQEKLNAIALLRAECQGRMLHHFFQVSRTMPADQGRRYLELMLRKTCLPEPGMMHEP